MVRTISTMSMPLGGVAPSFALPDTQGKTVRMEEFSGAKALLVMFICNHCPFVKHIRAELAKLGRDYGQRGVAIAGISSNDVRAHPDDSPARMAEEARSAGYIFPYLFDETQEVAKTYRAACTPDFFLFDAQRKLVYRGQLDDSRPGNNEPVTGKDLRGALDALLGGRPIPSNQKPSMGCNIKWKQGNEPEYFK